MTSWPVTAGQRRRLERLAAGDPAARAAFAWRAWLVHGALEPEALATACRSVAARHPALHARFARSGADDGGWRAHGPVDSGAGRAAGVTGAPAGPLWVHDTVPSRSEVVDVVTAILERQARHNFPVDVPQRFRLHLAPVGPVDSVLVLAADPLAVDEQSMAGLARAIAYAYAGAVAGHTPLAGPDRRWWAYVEAEARAAAPAPPPPWWRDLRAHMARHGGHAVADLPLALPLRSGEPATPCVTSTTIGFGPDQVGMVAAEAGVEPLSVVLVALAAPLAGYTGDAVRVSLDVDRRGPGDDGAIGAWTSTGVVAVPPRSADEPRRRHLARVDRMLAVATGADGVAWADRSLAAAVSAPRHPTLTLAVAPDLAALDLPDAVATPLGRTGLGCGGQVAFELRPDGTTVARTEACRLDDGFLDAVTALARDTLDAYTLDPGP